MNAISLFIIGASVGYIIGMLALMFFQDVIFEWMDRCVNRVRGWFGLDPI